METTNKELELEAVDWVINTSQHKSVKNGFIAGATSKYVEKQKLEFAISLLLRLRAAPVSEIDNKVFELEEQLYKL